MAEKKPQIVIKKITVVSGGAHGGAWKVAFADFMTAMMAFFLVMWLVNQTDEAQKKAISDYFSTPSVIEYQFNNYGVELTLEKLFIDLVNEPLKVFQSFVTPVDRTPNVMAMGQKKVVAAHLTSQLGEAVGDIDVTADSVVFEIPDHLLFEKGSASPSGQFIEILEKVKGVTTGLEDSDIQITSVVSVASVKNRDPVSAKIVSEERLDLFNAKVKSSLESDSVDVSGRALVRSGERSTGDRKAADGYIRVEIKKKKTLPEVRNPQAIQDSSFGEAQSSKSVYDNFVNQVSKQKRKEPESEKRQ